MLYKIDKKILNLIDDNPRISQSEMSKKLDIPQQTINYRIRKLKNENQIKKFAALINYMKLGYYEYHVFFRIENMPENETAVMEYFSKHKKMWWAAKIGSFYDIMVQLVVRNIEEIEDFLEELNRMFPNVFGDHITLQVIRHELFNHPFLKTDKLVLKRKVSYELSKENIDIDNLDFRLLGIIKDNCRMPVAEMSRALGCSCQTVKERIRKLEERKIVVGYRMFHNIRIKKAFLALIRYRNFSKEQERRLLSQVYQINDFTQYWKLFGEFNLLLHARCDDYEQFQDTFTKLRDKNRIISDYKLIPVFKDIVVNTFPCGV
ncbi:Lrp/AsnC family transcriptional regulator [Candidatus Woesearchaeota archaeon]|nr:Lrp/AsnC family transcriptional regulator [Candidatus Woesearchaeota archaeon]